MRSLGTQKQWYVTFGSENYQYITPVVAYYFNIVRILHFLPHFSNFLWATTCPSRHAHQSPVHSLSHSNDSSALEFIFPSLFPHTSPSCVFFFHLLFVLRQDPNVPITALLNCVSADGLERLFSTSALRGAEPQVYATLPTQSLLEALVPSWPVASASYRLL